MKGREILERQLGKPLNAGKRQSLVLRKEVADPINVTFLKFGDEWIRIVTTDEQTNICLNENIDEVQFFEDDEFRYALTAIEQTYQEFNNLIGKRLLKFRELISVKAEHFSFGLNLYFEDDLNFIIRNHEYPIDRTEYLFEKVEFEDLKEN